jgi:signal transduction histidine kinase
MLSTSKDLLLFVDNLCDYARFEQGKLEHAAGPFNLCDLLNETELYARSLAGIKEIELIVECQEVFVNSMVHTNRSLLRKLLFNLVSNAMKNTSAGTVTILSTEKIMDGMDYLEVSVADTGRGFGSDELNQLFGDISSPQSSVGLIIARKISEILGGSLETESVAGKGSVFTAVIPNSG